MGIPKTSDHIQTKIKMPHLNQDPPASFKSPNEDLKDIDILGTFEIDRELKYQNMGVSKTSDQFQIKIKMSNFSQEPPVSFKAPNEDLKDIDILCTFKTKMETQNSDHRCIKDQ